MLKERVPALTHLELEGGEDEAEGNTMFAFRSTLRNCESDDALLDEIEQEPELPACVQVSVQVIPESKVAWPLALTLAVVVSSS
jgi:hypothetical protein